MSTVLSVFFSLVLFVGGLLLFGYADAVVGYEILMFVAGILAVSASMAIPAHLLKRVG